MHFLAFSILCSVLIANLLFWHKKATLRDLILWALLLASLVLLNL